nr:hypothetical protein Iba_chr14dCG15880 [Ipomoea batatas]
MLFFLIQLRKLYLHITGLIDIPVTMDFSGAFEVEESPPDSEDTEMISTTPSFEVGESSNAADPVLPTEELETVDLSSASSLEASLDGQDTDSARVTEEIEEPLNAIDSELASAHAEFEEISSTTFDLETAQQDEVGHPPIAADPESLTDSLDPLLTSRARRQLLYTIVILLIDMPIGVVGVAKFDTTQLVSRVSNDSGPPGLLFLLL